MALAPRSLAPLLTALALGLGFVVSRGQWLVPAAILALMAILLVALVADAFAVKLLVVAALLQPPLGNFGSIPELKLAELVVPILLLALALRVPGRQRESARLSPARPVGFDPTRAINFAVGAYAVVLALNFLRSRYLLGPVVPGVNRTFYDYFIALGAYLLLYSLFTRREFRWSRLIRFLFWLSAIASIAGLAAVALHLPLNLGSLRYSVYDYASGAVRVGFLETFGTVGLAIVVATKGRFRVASGLLFGAALVESGGRAAVIGAIIATALYFVTTRRSLRVAGIGVIVVIVVLALPTIGANPQTQRLLQLNQREFATDGRLYIYSQSLRGFARAPLVGTGIGVPVLVFSSEPELSAFYEAQLEVGGHGTYVALLKDLGLLGFLPFAGALLIALAFLAPLTRYDPVAGFFFLLLASGAVNLLVSGSGSDPVYFFALAGGSAVLASRRRAAGPLASKQQALDWRFSSARPVPPNVNP